MTTEERYARDLHHALLEALGGSIQEVHVEGSGVHWTCSVACGKRACLVSCFDSSGPEYLTRFNLGTQDQAWGRTQYSADTVAAVARWLSGAEVRELHDTFLFVDEQKRALMSLSAAAVLACPELQGVEHALRHQLCDIYEYEFTAGDRSCRLSRYGNNQHPDAFFNWDVCQMFRFRADNPERLGSVLQRWLCDRASPSSMAADFPWLSLDPVASYYEAGCPVEGEFQLSWDSVQEFYRTLGRKLKGPTLSFIEAVRRAGYTRLLRAGQSMFTLVVSRSRRHGLRPEQPFIAFEFIGNGMRVTLHIGSSETYTFPAIEFTPEVESLLKRLVSVPID